MNNEQKECLKAWEDFSVYVSSYIEKEKLELDEFESRIKKSFTTLQKEFKILEQKQFNFSELSDSISEKFKELIKEDKIFSQKVNKHQESLNKFLSIYEEKLNIAKGTFQEIKTTQNEIDKQLEKYQNIDIYVKELNSKLFKLEEQQKNIILAIKKLQSTQSNNVSSVSINLDYIHPKSISYLYEKYKNTNTPVIVRKILPTESSPKVWSDNYCFHVEKIEDSKAVGSYYENGKKKIIKGQSSPNIKTQSYVLYGNKDEVNAIVRSLKG